MEEQWMPVKGYEGLYEVSNTGKVRSLKNSRHNVRKEPLLKKQRLGSWGYPVVALCKEGKSIEVLVHRIVAEAFIPNPNGYEVVNHKDEVKTNNLVENLEWCTQKYNNNYGTAKQRGVETRKKNGTTSSSKGEQYIKQKLEEKFYIVEHNYKQDPRYPFYCDFYIPDLDLFIEYQGFEGHGNHPFNSQCKEDLLILEHWIEKAEQRKLDKRNKYLGYIETWTQKDPLKRQTAKQNNLNWIEFFTLKEFDNWYKNLEKLK